MDKYQKRLLKAFESLEQSMLKAYIELAKGRKDCLWLKNKLKDSLDNSSK